MNTRNCTVCEKAIFAAGDGLNPLLNLCDSCREEDAAQCENCKQYDTKDCMKNLDYGWCCEPCWENIHV